MGLHLKGSNTIYTVKSQQRLMKETQTKRPFLYTYVNIILSQLKSHMKKDFNTYFMVIQCEKQKKYRVEMMK